MTISVTELKARLLEIIRQVEREGKTVEVERHGQVVARLIPAVPAGTSARPWMDLRGGGELLASPEESVFDEREFEALR
jgi:prevent-host-death family protein